MANVINKFTTSKNRGQTRIRFFQNGIRPLDIHEETSDSDVNDVNYTLLITTGQILYLEIENFSFFERVFLYTVKNNDNEIIYMSPFYYIPGKEFLRIHGRPKVYLLPNLVKPYIIDEDDDSTTIEVFSSRKIELARTTIREPKELTSLRKAGKFEIVIKYTPE
jgi:hypothetical protein